MQTTIDHEANRGQTPPFRLQHTVVCGDGLNNPGLTLAEMLEASDIDRRFPALTVQNPRQ